jgi:hypothetical protein
LPSVVSAEKLHLHKKNVKAINSLFRCKSVDLVQDIYGDISARNLPTEGRKGQELEQI